ncbi:hypothetical protein DFS34DRAFT_364552 [Phlyctochytrium arcticum]|nr:hypothetical protein DFS34DRAFT_364552 [Phlyctochytrium arcticum]
MQPVYAILTVIFLILLGFLGLSPSSTVRPYLPPPLRDNDKLLHFACFTILAFLVYRTLNLKSGGKNCLVSGVLLGAASVGSEVLQGLVSSRIFDAKDIIANLGGSVLGIGIAATSTFLNVHCIRRHRKGYIQSQQPDEMPLTATSVDEHENDDTSLTTIVVQ